jgi:hypothetical protein
LFQITTFGRIKTKWVSLITGGIYWRFETEVAGLAAGITRS